MGALTNVRMSRDSVVSVTTLGTCNLPPEQSMVIREVIVPPVAHGPNETISVITGNEVVFDVPLRLLTDLYKVGRDGAHEPLCQVEEEPLSFVLRRCVMAWDVADDDPTGPAANSESRRAIAVTQELVKAIENRPRVSLGFRLDRAILLPPWQTLSVESSEGSVVTVWLRGLMSEMVT